jgi:universal stress protein A
VSKYQNILVAYDLRPDSATLLQKAVLLQQSSLSAESCKVSVLHVVEHLAQAYGGEFSIPVDMQAEEKLDALARQQCVANMAEHSLAADNLIIKEGLVKQLVIQVAEEHNADLILVGTHRATGIERLLGSRAQAILNVAKCEVLSIPL